MKLITKKTFFLNKNLLQKKEKLIQLQPKICDWLLYKYFEEWRDDFIKSTKFEGEQMLSSITISLAFCKGDNVLLSPELFQLIIN